jgi:hypothetical protein
MAYVSLTQDGKGPVPSLRLVEFVQMTLPQSVLVKDPVLSDTVYVKHPGGVLQLQINSTAESFQPSTIRKLVDEYRSVNLGRRMALQFMKTFCMVIFM